MYLTVGEITDIRYLPNCVIIHCYLGSKTLQAYLYFHHSHKIFYLQVSFGGGGGSVNFSWKLKSAEILHCGITAKY